MEFLQEFMIALGGGATALIALFTICKTVFWNFFEKGIDTAFEKNLEKYKNMLTRATTAYEILLNKELDFYTKIDPLFAELIVLVQDLVFYSVGYELDFNEQREKYREYFLRYCELINEIKKEVLIYQSYIPNDIFTACSNVIGQMQMDLEYWKLTAKILFHAPYEEIDEAKSNEKSDRILKKIAYSEVLIKKRLTALSKLN